MFVALSVPLQRRRRPPPLRAASSRRLTELRAHAEGVVMSRFLFSTSAIAAALLTSNPAVAEATEGEFDRSEAHTSDLQSQMRISYADCCLQKTNTIKWYHY